MEYTVIETATKPNKAPDKFCVYKIDGEEYMFCPIIDTSNKHCVII